MSSSNEDDGAKKPAEKRKELFDSLRAEMEIAQYATIETGQRRRKVPRKQSAARAKKRKILEKADRQEGAIVMQEEDRMRGSRSALEDDVIHGSQVFAEGEAKIDDEDEDMDAEVSEGGGEEDDEEMDDDEGEGDEDAEKVAENESSSGATGVGVTSKKVSSGNKKQPAAQKKKRLMYRMRSFKSARMAERHGDALGAHARGHSLAAVRKLEQVANYAPAAPQVYSSLGMVYESLLSDSRNKPKTDNGEKATIKSIEKQLELAKKAYGSYHVAALLCKKDFSLWVRAGDTAKEIAELYTEVMALPETQYEKREELRSEKRKWIEEARKDFLAADNQRPPGIDVPAKLAAAQMELGNLSEALVILTDLKNCSTATDEAHSEFEKSYKAWLLYADLMLRIGHECIQWNDNNQENANYMFRRWLRKWSVSFDWKERRLQALVQALEAAAGSRCCKNLVAWSKNRALNAAAGHGDETSSNDKRRWHVDLYETAKDPPQTKQGEGEGKEDDQAAENDVPSSTVVAGDSSAWTLDRARDALLAKNRLELELFDEEMEKHGLAAGSAISHERASARDALVNSHKKSVVDLIGNYHQHQAVIESALAGNGYVVGDNGDASRAIEPLPISASCSAVCSIASELMKHCLRNELYVGARLAGEAVSLYLKERAASIERRLESNRSFAEKQKSTAESVLLSVETYDEVGEDESDEDADDLYLSDDEVILESSDQHLFPSLKNGILPPELRLLYALSLIGEGGRTFLAKQCLKAIAVLEADDIDALITDPVDTDIVKDPLWYGFRQDQTEPLHKTAALVLAVYVLQKANKEAEYADIVTPLLQNHLENLKSSGKMDLALFGREGTVAVPTRNRFIKLMLASSRMQIQYAESIAVEEKEESTEIAVSVLDRVIPLLQKFWKVEANGSVPSFCIEGMHLLTRTFMFLTDLRIHSQVDPRVFAKLLEALSLLCEFVIPDPSSSDVQSEQDPFKDQTEFPIKAYWQNVSHELISKRVYNLAVACLVSNFSGWERDEFHLDLLRPTYKESHFGVHIGDERVRGPLSPSIEAELADQWKHITNFVPQFADFDFQANLDAAKSSSWYKEVMDVVSESMAAYGEEDGFQLFLTLSRLSFKAAYSTKDRTTSIDFLKLGLSVVLPLSEFCLDMNLWESQLGKAALTKTGSMYDWNKVAKCVGQTGEGTGRRRRPQIKRVEPPKRRALPTMIRIPVSALLSQWNEGKPTKRIDSKEAKEAMRKVDKATLQLRTCYTETAIQKGCIQVALTLMELVAKDYCYNPFLCLQQAAIFAAQGSNGGNNDKPFKAPLPAERECTAHEALVVIGRADCLQSLHFADEAIYLCSYIARVCKLHRDTQDTDMEWNAQWKVVGICLYNLSVAIRTTRSFQEECSRPEYFEESIVQELKRGRSDAIVVKSLLPGSGAAAVVSDQGGHESSEDEEDFFEDNNQEQGLVDIHQHMEGDVEMMDAAGGVLTFPSNGLLPASGAVFFGGSDNEEEREIVAV